MEVAAQVSLNFTAKADRQVDIQSNQITRLDPVSTVGPQCPQTQGTPWAQTQGPQTQGAPCPQTQCVHRPSVSTVSTDPVCPPCPPWVRRPRVSIHKPRVHWYRRVTEERRAAEALLLLTSSACFSQQQTRKQSTNKTDGTNYPKPRRVHGGANPIKAEIQKQNQGLIRTQRGSVDNSSSHLTGVHRL